MPTHRDQAICLRQIDWSETSQVVTLFAREAGIVRAVAKGARRERAPYSGGVEVLTRGEMVAIIKSTGAMATLTAWDLLDPMPQLRRSLGAHYAALYLADATQRALSELDPHPTLYDALVLALDQLAADPPPPVCLRYLWILLTEIGYRPDLDAAPRAPGARADPPVIWFDPAAGRIQSTGGAGMWQARAQTIDTLRRAAAGEADPPEPGESTIRALRLVDAYLTHLLGRPIPAAGAFFAPGGPGALPR